MTRCVGGLLGAEDDRTEMKMGLKACETGVT